MMASSIPITLEDVFQFWRGNEAWNSKWQQVAREKGFPNWETWRRAFLERLQESTESEWVLEEIKNPLVTVPHWRGGPFSGWIKKVYQGRESMLFSEIIEQPFLINHDYIPGLVANFPKLTVLSVVADRAGNTFVVEGMHRTCALAVMAREGKPLQSRVFVTRGKLKEGAKLEFAISRSERQ